VAKNALDYSRSEREFENSEPRNCILLPNQNLIVAFDETNNLFRIDRNSKIIWKNQEKIFHHAMNPGPAGNIWICTSGVRSVYDHVHEINRPFRDDYLTQIDPATGKILQDKSVADILLQNGYRNFVYGFTNRIKSSGNDWDPLHLNDIEPAISSSPYWQKGDLFVSLRHRSLVFQYEPENGKIRRLLYGPFLNQHDVDLISDNKLSIFNNNVSVLGLKSEAGNPEIGDYRKTFGPPDTTDHTLSSSDIIIYDFDKDTFEVALKNQFEEENLLTLTQGFHKRLSTGDFYVEDQNNGKVYIMNEQEILFSKAFSTSIDGMVERPHWIRIYENLNF
jgi:hypothetical protein